MSFNSFNLNYFDKIDSTNNKLEQLAREGMPEWTVVVAGEQTAGRGRNQRFWESPPGLGLWFSVLLVPNIKVSLINLINLTTAVAIREFIEQKLKSVSPSFHYPVNVKWPNDIWLNERKLCGILLESSIKKNEIDHLIVGIGLNVNQCRADFPPDLQNSAISLKMVNDMHWDLDILLDEFLRFYKRELNDAFSDKFRRVIKEYNKHLLFKNTAIRVDLKEKTVEGELIGINSKGYLLLKKNRAEILVTAGDVWQVK